MWSGAAGPRRGQDALCRGAAARAGDRPRSIVNAENAAHGFGLTERLAGELYDCRRRHPDDRQPRLGPARVDRLYRARPAPAAAGQLSAEGRPAPAGACIRSAGGRNVAGRQPDGPAVHGRARRPLRRGSTRSWRSIRWAAGATAIIVDFHAEAISEKMAFGHFADGRVSAVLGTHTHVPTADAQILPGGTAYISDAGMCGDYDSVIGMQKAPSVRRFVTKMPGEKAAAGRGRGDAVRRLRRDRRRDRPRAPDRAGAGRRPPCRRICRGVRPCGGLTAGLARIPNGNWPRRLRGAPMLPYWIVSPRPC